MHRNARRSTRGSRRLNFSPLKMSQASARKPRPLSALAKLPEPAKSSMKTSPTFQAAWAGRGGRIGWQQCRCGRSPRTS
eukprot:11172579-Lingulodinium_polyedra.AAC.1